MFFDTLTRDVAEKDYTPVIPPAPSLRLSRLKSAIRRSIGTTFKDSLALSLRTGGWKYLDPYNGEAFKPFALTETVTCTSSTRKSWPS